MDSLEQIRIQKLQQIRALGFDPYPTFYRYTHALAAVSKEFSEKYDGIVALGCVLRGETPHFEYISRAVSDGLQQVALDTGIPVGFGVLTVDTVEQAMDRSGESGNKGFEAAMAALEMIDVLRQI